MTTLELKNNFIKLSSDVKKLAEEFLNLSYIQINWRPADSQWSIAECFEHLVRTNVKFIPVYKIYTVQEYENKELEFKPTLIGKLVLKSVMPGYNRKFKTPAPFNPIGSDIKESIVKDFLKQNSEITELVKIIDSSKLRKKITSPFSKFVKYSIGESFIIIGNHNLRHLQQAGRVMQNEKFPA
jgi:hypothetical protein